MKKLLYIFLLLPSLVFAQTKVKTNGLDTSSTGVLPKANLFPLSDTRYQRILTFDGLPTNGSSNSVTSGNIYTYVNTYLGADGIVSGLVTTTVTTTATTTAGTYRLNNLLVTKGSSTNTTIDAQDATLNRYDLIVGDASGVFTKVQGTLSADAVEPDIPTNKALIASIYIPATGGTVTTGGGGTGKGTVTKVTSATTDILVANQTTTPVLTLNKINGVSLSFFNPTSAIQGQLNAKVSSIAVTTANGVSGSSSGGTTPSLTLTLGNITPTSIVTTIKPTTVYQTPSGTAGTDSVMVKHSDGTVKAISPTYYGAGGFSNPMTSPGDLIVGTTAGAAARLAPGTANQLLHSGTTPSWSNIVNADIANSTIDLTTKVTGILPNGNTTATSAATASAIVSRDANGNTIVNNLIQNAQSIATAAGTTTLTVSSPKKTIFTGTTTQTLVLPVASTLTQYTVFDIVNSSTGAVTVQSSGANTIVVLAGGSTGTFTCILTSGTTAASWSFSNNGAIAGSNKEIQVNNSGAFGSTPYFTYDITSKIFNVKVATGQNFIFDSDAGGAAMAFRNNGTAIGFIGASTGTGGASELGVQSQAKLWLYGQTGIHFQQATGGTTVDNGDFTVAAGSINETSTVANVSGINFHNTSSTYNNNLIFGYTTRARNSAFNLIKLSVNNTADSVFKVNGNGQVVGNSFVTMPGSLSAINSTATATAAQIHTGIITSTSAAPTSITLPSATSIASVVGFNAGQGTTMSFTVDNTAGASTVTIILGSGMTGLNSPTLTIPAGASGVAKFQLYFSSTSACTIARIY